MGVQVPCVQRATIFTLRAVEEARQERAQAHVLVCFSYINFFTICFLLCFSFVCHVKRQQITMSQRIVCGRPKSVLCRATGFHTCRAHEAHGGLGWGHWRVFFFFIFLFLFLFPEQTLAGSSHVWVLLPSLLRHGPTLQASPGEPLYVSCILLCVLPPCPSREPYCITVRGENEK